MCRIAAYCQPSSPTLSDARLDRALLRSHPRRAQQLLPQRLDLALDLVLRRILILELVPQLEALDLDRPLALVVEDRRVGLAVLDLRVAVVVERLELVPRPQVRELERSEGWVGALRTHVALDIARSTRATRRRQA